MGRMNGFAARVRDTFSRGAAERRAAEEIELHIELETARHVAAGADAREARRRALVAFGGVERVREELRAGRRVPLLEEFWRDVRYGGRSLGRSPGFTVVAVLTLALGIGASTAMFSVLHGVLLRELPVQAEEELVVLWTASPAGASDHLPLTYAELVALRERGGVFEAVAGVAYQGALEQVLLEAGEPVTFTAAWVTGEFFPVLGVVPVLGRTLQPSDDRPAAEPVVVIGHGLWQRHFGGAPSVIGSVFEWEGLAYTVVGVLPPGIEYPRGAELWLPVLQAFPGTLDPGAGPAQAMVFNLVARLGRGAGAEVARAELDTFLREGDAERPAALRGRAPVVTPLSELIVGDARGRLWAATAAVGLLLLIACVNVANLLLIRGSARTREVAVRRALGAGKRRVVRQLLTESAVLAALAGVAGVVMAFGALRVLLVLAPAELPRRELIALDGRVLLFALGATFLAALLAGLVPAVVAAAGDASRWLRGSGRTTAGHGGRRLRQALVVGQVALAILVVAGAGLLVRSLVLLQNVDVGYDRDRLIVVQLTLPAHLVPERERQVALLEAAAERLAAMPGVAGAASLPRPPFAAQGAWSAMFTGEGQTADAQADNPWVAFEVVGPGFFETLGMRLVSGRGFDGTDRADAPPVAVISESVARQAWPGADAVGRRIKLGPPEGAGAWHTVIGVVADTRYRELAEPQPSLYLATRQFPGPVPMSLAVRTRGDPGPIMPQLRTALLEVHPDLLLVGGGPVRQLLARPLAQPRFTASLFGAFGILTLVVAAVGIYAALAAAVRERTHEIGVRMALGAEPGTVHGLVLREGLTLAVAGCAIGIAAALVATRALRSLLFGVVPADPLTFGAVALLILAAAAIACYLPARRASRLDPLLTLRAD